MTNRWQTSTFANDSPERKTRALEGSSNKFKLTTQRNKAKTTMDSYHPGWNKGTSQQSRSPVRSLSTKSSATKQIIKCGQCENDGAKLKCLDCMEMYCADCYSHFHLRGALQYHRSIPISDNHLTTSPKKQQYATTNSSQKRVPLRSSTNDFRRRSLMTLHLQESGDTPNDRTNLASFQHSFLQWRDKNINRAEQNRYKRGYVPSINESTLNGLDYTTKLPSIESNSSRTHQHDQRTTQEEFMQRFTRSNLMKRDQPKANIIINIHHSSSDHTESRDSNTEVQPLNEELILTQPEESVQTMPSEEIVNEESNLEQNEVEERPVTHVSSKSSSRPTSSLMHKDSVPSRPGSLTHQQQALRESLTTKSNDELEAIIGAALTFSRSSSSIVEMADQSSDPLPQTPILEPNVPTSIDPPTPADLPEITKRSLISIDKDQSSDHVFRLDSVSDTPRRHSPFSFANSLSKLERISSFSSTDAGEGGFFTDVLPQKVIVPPPPPPILECSTSNEWKHALENETPQTMPLPKSPVRRSSRGSVKLEEIHRPSEARVVSCSRPESSASLPVSISSSKSSFDHPKDDLSAVSSRKNSSSSSASTLKNFPSTPKKTLASPVIIPPSTSNECSQVSTESLKDKTSFNSQGPENSNDLLKESSKKLSPRDQPVRKRGRPSRQTSKDASKCRKLGFSMGDGLQWQEASTESILSAQTPLADQSSHVSTARSLALSNPINTELAQEFCRYDNDDGRSSRTYQNVNDEECFNQLRQELCSQLEMISSDEDAILNEQLLNILQSVRLPLLEPTPQ